MQIANCTRCGKVFGPAIGRRLCPDCAKLDQEEFDAVRNYLRENPGADIVEVSEATGVPVKRIQEYLREGRLVLAQGVEWLKCEQCGKPIVTGRFCPECAAKLGSGPAPPSPEPPEPVRFTGRGKVIRDKWRRWL